MALAGSRMDSTRAFFNKPRPVNAPDTPISRFVFEETCALLPVGDGAGRALELGCHWGRYTCQLAESFGEVVGVDFAEATVATARRLPNVEYQVMDLNSDVTGLRRWAPLDACIAIAILEMLLHPAAVCAEVASILKPGGTFLALIPEKKSLNFRSFRLALRLRRTLRSSQYGLYFNGLTAEKLREMLMDADFEITGEGDLIGLPVYLVARLPHRWQRFAVRHDRWFRRSFGGSYRWFRAVKR